jgi:predicted PurR-regulated permease PerM
MGQNLGLSNLVVFLSVLFWGSLLGVVGMMLCVPFTLAVKFALESSDQTLWIALLLERTPHVPLQPTDQVASSGDRDTKD